MTSGTSHLLPISVVVGYTVWVGRLGSSLFGRPDPRASTSSERPVDSLSGSLGRTVVALSLIPLGRNRPSERILFVEPLLLSHPRDRSLDVM